MPLETQIILLRVLEEYKYESLGSNKSKVADIRLITAISQNPEQLVEKGTFRKDLYFRLNTGILRIPPLRERKEDIPLLLNYYMNKFHCNKIIEDKAMDILMNYRWPGNVRQLVQVVQAFNVFVAGDTISEHDIPVELKSSNTLKNIGFLSLPQSIQILEKQKITEALKLAKGKDNEAIKLLGVSRNKFYDMKKKYGLMKIDQFE